MTYPISHPSFSVTTQGEDYAGLGAMWAELTKPTQAEAGKQFDALQWVPKVKEAAGKLAWSAAKLRKAEAICKLQVSYKMQLQERAAQHQILWIIQQLPDVIKACMDTYLPEPTENQSKIL